MFESAKGNSQIDKYAPLKRQDIELTNSYLLVYYAKCLGNFLILIFNIVLIFIRLKQEKEDFLNPALRTPLPISLLMPIFIVLERILTVLYFIQQSKKLGKGVGAPILHTLSFTDFFFMRKHLEVSDLWCLQVQKAAREVVALNIPFCYFGLIIFFDQIGIKKGKYDLFVFFALLANFTASISAFYSMYIYRSMYSQFFVLKQNMKFNDHSMEARKFISNPYIVSWFKVFSEEVKKFDEVYKNPERKNIDQLYTYNQEDIDFEYLEEFEEYDYDLLKKELRVSILKKTWLVFYFGFFISTHIAAFVQAQYTKGGETFSDFIMLYIVTAILMFPQILIHLNYATRAPQGCARKLLGFFLNLIGIPFAVLVGMLQFIIPIRNEPVPLYLAQSRANWVENFYPVSYQMLCRFVILTMQRAAINNLSDPDKWIITEHGEKMDYLIDICQTKFFYRLSALVNSIFVCTIFLYLGYFFEYLEVHYLGGRVKHEPIQQVDEKAVFFHSFYNNDIDMGQNENENENEIVKLDDDGSYRDEDMNQSDHQIESPPYKPNDDLYGSAYNKKDDIKI